MTVDKIQNVDLREALDAIARNNTFFHRENDLGISIEQMERTAKQKDYLDKTLIWVSYPSGIDCYPEREVFQQDTRGYNGVLYHGKGQTQSDRRLAYAVDVSGIKDGILYGSLYEIDIRDYSKYVHAKAVPSNTVRIYENSGSETVMPKDEFNRRYPLDLVKIAYWRHEPDDPAALKAVQDDIWNNGRDGKHTVRDLWSHTNRLYEERDAFYSDQILRDLDKLQKPNSPDSQYYITSLDGRVAAGLDSEHLSRVLDKLPYKNAEFSIKKGQRNMLVIVPCDEVQLERWKQQGKPLIKDGKEIPVAMQKNEKRGQPDKPSILDALIQGTEKSKGQDSNKLQKSKGMEM
jgi:hypothetical protein